MVNKNNKDILEQMIEDGYELDSDIPENLDDKARIELESLKQLDSVLKKEWPKRSIAIPTSLESFRLPSTKKPTSVGILRLWPVAAAILVVLTAAFWVLLTAADPTGDSAKIEALLAASIDTTQSPTAIRESQKELVTYLSQYYGSYTELKNQGRFPDLDGSYRKSCENTEKRGIEAIKPDSLPVDTVLAIEKIADDCNGLISQSTAMLYREKVNELVAQIEESFNGYRNNEALKLDWASGPFADTNSIFEGDNPRNAQQIYLAWRAMIDGQAKAEISDKLNAIPQNIRMTLAITATHIVARKLRYHSEIIGNADILVEAAKGLEKAFNDSPLQASQVIGVFSTLPLWASFFEHKQAVPPRLRRVFGNVENLFLGLEAEMSRNRASAYKIVETLRIALSADDKYLLNNASGAPEWRTVNLFNEVAFESISKSDELADLIYRANFMRFMLGRSLVSVVFETNKEAAKFNINDDNLKSGNLDPTVAKQLYFGSENRVFPILIESKNSISVQIHLYSSEDGALIPRRTPPPKTKAETTSLPNSGDAPGRF